MALYDKYSALRDRFEILAFHDATVSTFEELDEKLEPIREKYWAGKSLPFPILLDATRTTKAVVFTTEGVGGYEDDIDFDGVCNVCHADTGISS